ncbi:heparan-alpha-glucosaminide N-acetyltransferase-like [Venturia canescens]|uniref:heparan-alpha-glucosaminide N-acetyltransferase-like n=1 Tax=Venturia canescens TaxID=32260 RepID=UPI001C9C7D7D|nr:heparan-alpha-glucosaminide N-acetyltransferase-like [Venturia canescens]
MAREDCKLEELGIDEACLVLTGHHDQDYNATLLYSLSSDCVLCPYSRIASIEPGNNISVRVNAARSATWRIYEQTTELLQDYRSVNDESGLVCQFQPNIGEYGIYKLSKSEEGEVVDVGAGWKFRTILEPRNSYTPLAAIFGIVLCLIFVLWLVKMCLHLTSRVRRRNNSCSVTKNKGNKRVMQLESTGTVPGEPVGNSNVNDERSGDEAAAGSRPRGRRIFSIDTFRGISILTMIFVNNGAGGYFLLEHATWDGLLIGDLVFPCFVWIMGVCIPIALSSQLARGTSRLTIARGILKRSVLLFLIDLSTNSIGAEADLKRMRLFGVLQRFAIAYAFVGLLYVFFSSRIENKKQPGGRTKTFADVRCLLGQWIVILAVTALHCAITFGLPVPGCPTGYLGPGGRHAEGRFANCTGGATGYIDRIILGSDHVYQRPTIASVYGSGPFEPEGILGCLTTILQTFLGVQTGKTLRIHAGWKSRVSRCLALAILCGFLGCALHFSGIIPINKNLWSLSFVLSTTAFALGLFVVCYLLVDVARVWLGGPFRIPGMNALVMYVGHRILYQMFPFHWKYGEETSDSHEWRTIAAVWDVGMWTILAYVLHRKRIYISL